MIMRHSSTDKILCIIMVNLCVVKGKQAAMAAMESQVESRMSVITDLEQG